MQSLRRSIRNLQSIASSACSWEKSSFSSASNLTNPGLQSLSRISYNEGHPSMSLLSRHCQMGLLQKGAMLPPFPIRSMTASAHPVEAALNSSGLASDPPARIKFKRLDKTAKNIMNIIDKEAVEEVKEQREIPDIRPGYIIQLKLVVPENKRRVSIIKGIVIARRNAGLNTTFRLRRQVAGVGVESLFPLYSPNIKEITVLDKKKVRRAKLYYLREKMNALKKH